MRTEGNSEKPMRISERDVNPRWADLAKRLCEDRDNLEFWAHKQTLIAVEVFRREGEVERVDALGCGVCLGINTVSKDEGGKRKIGDQEAIPLSAVSEDDSRNPVHEVLYLCPQCGRVLVDQEQFASGVAGMISDV